MCAFLFVSFFQKENKFFGRRDSLLLLFLKEELVKIIKMLLISVYMKDTKFEKEKIKKIFSKYRLGKVKKIVYLESGIVNPCLAINDQFILRVNVRDKDTPKFKREKVAFKKLKDKIPVPRIVILDESKKIIPYDYLITEKMPGIETREVLKKMPEQEKKKIAIQAGIILAKIHKIKFKKFGYINGNTFGKYDNWNEFIINKVKNHLKEMKKENIFNDEKRKEILNLFEKNKKIFLEIKTPRLNHGDFSFENMVFKNKKITGIFDFEWAMSGDSEYDFKDLEDFGELKDLLLEGYQRINKLSYNFNTKILFYQLVYKLELAKVSKTHWDKKTHDWVKKEIIILTKRLKNSKSLKLE
jgi:aminoglycoside phosphotransferase (APT) family kinase protein